MKVIIKSLLTLFLLSLSINTFALSMSAENQTNEKVYVHFYSKDTDLSTHTRTLLLKPHQTRKVSFASSSPKEFYMYAGDKKGHNCVINSSESLKVSKVSNQLNCSPNYA